MNTIISTYLQKINHRYQTGISREHSYRGDLQNLLESLVPDVMVTNEPARISCGAPDYILTRKNIPIGYIEAKDIGADLESKLYREQIDRYRRSLNNLTVTDYLKFYFYKEGDFITSISIAEPEQKSIKPLPGAFEHFNTLISDFVTTPGQTITSAKRLAKMMAGKARLMANIIEAALNNDEVSIENTALREQMLAFKDILIHDITNKDFADIYSQTIAYGMFAARLHDPTLSDFNRYEAAGLIPKSNPFLRKLFQYIAGYDLDPRINWTVDALADIFRATDVKLLLKDFGKATQQNDPMIHFYETFLFEYDPKLRKSRGVWYTPEPVVNFMVRAVDDILKTEFHLKDGLASIDKTKIKVNTQNSDKRTSTGYRLEEKEVHKVQILDPATGTGTFLAQIVKQIHTSRFGAMQGVWSKYVEDHLIPRLNGFEILMASYAMAHLKLDMLLSETGYKPTKDQRLRIYLTNSLEEHHPDTGTLFANWLSSEANEANHIKRDTPVMCIIGNPPYNGESSNKGKWIMKLMEDYKMEPGAVEKLKEKNSKWINDDYVKFLRYGQFFIEKNGEGILAFINPHGYLDNPTFRGMRWHLLKTYDKLYTLDLHGNTNKGEVCPDGSPDFNVFDIIQGVSINLFVKTGKKKPNELGKVFHYDLFGKRNYKYDFLRKQSLYNLEFSVLPNLGPEYYFVPKDYQRKAEYDKGFKLDELFPLNGNGIVTKRDRLCIHNTPELSYISATDILNLDKNEFYKKYGLPSDVRDWKYEWAKEDIRTSNINTDLIKPINYRPFDVKYICYTGKSRGFVGWPVDQIMRNYLIGDNIGLLCPKAFKDEKFAHAFVTNKISEAIFLSSKTGSNAMNFPLYIYFDKDRQQNLYEKEKRYPNLKKKIVSEIAEILKLTFTSEKKHTPNTFSPFDVFDYIYAILHSPMYRSKYNDFLKTGYPRIPYPKSRDSFWKFVKLGSNLRELHLLRNPIIDQYITTYPENGDNKVAKPKYDKNKVWINDCQYFDNVPKGAWDLFVGGYQPAQKWLKDRKDQKLDFEDILHYQKIITALNETSRIMNDIDQIEFQ